MMNVNGISFRETNCFALICMSLPLTVSSPESGQNFFLDYQHQESGVTKQESRDVWFFSQHQRVTILSPFLLH